MPAQARRSTCRLGRSPLPVQAPSGPPCGSATQRPRRAPPSSRKREAGETESGGTREAEGGVWRGRGHKPRNAGAPGPGGLSPGAPGRAGLLAPRFYPRETRRGLPELSDEFVLFTATAFVGICCCSCHTQSGLTPPSRTPSPRCPPARAEAAASTPVTQVGPGPSSVRPLLRGWRDPVTNRAGPCPTPSESKHPR